MRKQFLTRRVGKTETAVAALLALTALAAQAGAAAAADQQNNELVVTGSRLATRGFQAPTPVTTWSSQELQLSGVQNVEVQLNDTPQFIASQNTGPTANTVPGGMAEANLRGFGEQRNLVLVNGRRFTISGPTQVTDLNTIPSALVQRIEVVTGGSSAVYGSDAITGVINFILKDNFQGVQFDAQNTVDQHTGTPDYSFDLTFGQNFNGGKGNISASFNYMNRGGFTQGDRGGWAAQSLGDGCVTSASWSSTHAGTPMAVPAGQTCISAGGRPGLIFSGSSTIPNGRFSGAGFGGSNAALNAALAAAGLPGLGATGFTFNDAGTTPRAFVAPGDQYNLAPFAYMVVPQERKMVNLFAHYEVDPKLVPYLEFHYSNNQVNAQLAPSSVGANELVNINNPYLNPQLQEVLHQLDLAETAPTTITNGTLSLTTTPNDGLAILNVSRRLPELGDRMALTDLTAYRVAVGARGDLGDASSSFLTNLRYDAYFTYAETNEVDRQNGAASLSSFQRGLLSVGGSAPLINPFGKNISAAAAQSIFVSSTNFTDTDQEVAAFNLTGELFKVPAGPVDFNTGAEWRRASTNFAPDSYLSTGDVSGFNAQKATKGSESVKEVYGEARVPLLQDMVMFKRLNVKGAFRYSDYDLAGVGGVWTYSFGGEWAPTDDIAFRAQYQRSIRAPNVGELYGGQTTSGPSLTDPCSSRQPASGQTDAVKQTCIATGVPAAAVFTFNVQPSPFINTVSGGNPNLGAETSNTHTAGVVITPHWIRNLAFSADYFNIDLSGAIAPLGSGAQNVLNLCYNTLQDASSPYCKAVNRDPITGQIVGPNYIETTLTNIGGVKTSGVDFNLNYVFNNGWGLFQGGSRFELASDITYTAKFTSMPSQSLPQQNRCVGAFGQTCGQPIPRLKGVNRLTWSNGPLTLSLRHRFIGSVTVDTYLLPLRNGSSSTPALANLTNPEIPTQHYIDLTGSWDFGKRFVFTAGVRNLFDKDPPVIGTPAPSDNTWAATYDIEGRVFFTTLQVRF
jgi:outer membrane receptor protein involved in Fe transport